MYTSAIVIHVSSLEAAEQISLGVIHVSSLEAAEQVNLSLQPVACRQLELSCAGLQAAALFTIQELETQTHEMQSHAQLLGFTFHAAQTSSLLTAGDEVVGGVLPGAAAVAQQPPQQQEEQPASGREAEPDEPLKAIAFRYI